MTLLVISQNNCWHKNLTWYASTGELLVVCIETTQLRLTSVFFPSLLSRNFDDKLSSNFHRFVILYICWDTPSEKTGLWQLPIMSSVLTKFLGKRSRRKFTNRFRLRLKPTWAFCPGPLIREPRGNWIVSLWFIYNKVITARGRFKTFFFYR